MTAAQEGGRARKRQRLRREGRCRYGERASEQAAFGVGRAGGGGRGAARARFGAGGSGCGVGRGGSDRLSSVGQAKPCQGESVGFFIYPPNRSHCRYRCRRRRPRPALLPLRRHRWPDSCAIHSPSFPLSLLSLPLYDTDGLRQIRSTDGGGRVAAIPELNFYGREGIRFRGSCPKCGLPLKKRKERRARGITERRPRVCLADASGTFQRVLVQETRLAGMNPILRPFYDFASNCLVEGSDERANDDKARHHLPRVGRACSRPTRSRSAARSLARSLSKLWFSGGDSDG